MAGRGDKKAKKAQGKKKKGDHPTRRPKQKGKIKKALNRRNGHAFQMRSEPPPHMKAEIESERLQSDGISPAVARNIANWRAQHHLL